MTQQIITTNEAVIKSMTIEVKVMKMTNRQVTLSVFRQLPEEPIINPWTGELQGLPWGRVNYHTGVGCDSWHLTHMHVVWRKGDELRRSIAYRPWTSSNILENFIVPSNFYRRAMFALEKVHMNYMAAMVLEGWSGPDDSYPSALVSNVNGVDICNRDLTIGKGELLRKVWNEDKYLRYGVTGDRSRNSYVEQLRQLLEEEEYPIKSSDIFYNQLVDMVDEIKPIIEVWQQSYAQLEQLDQLFIAV